jgi:drug/metabolite transporter (DMT)-like permease
MISWKDHAWLHSVVLVFSLTAILGKMIALPISSMIFFRTLIAALSFAAVVGYRQVKLPSFREMVWIATVGIVIGIHWFCFFGSARLSTISLSLVMISTVSFFTSILEPLANGTPIRSKEVFLGLLVIAGMVIIFRFETDHFVAILVGLIGAFLASVYAVANSHLVKRYSSLVINFGQLCGAFLVAVFVVLVLLFNGSILLSDFIPGISDWIFLVILGIGCTVFPYLKLVSLLKKFSAFTVNLSINMEPVYGILLAWVVFGDSEKMSPQFYMGGSLIMLSLLLNALWSIRKKP